MSGKTMSMSFRINAALSNGFDKTFNKAGGSVASLGQKLNQYNRSAAKIEKILQLRKETKVLGDEYAAQKEKLDRLTRAVIDAKRPSESLIAQQQRAEKAVAKTKMAIVIQREALQRLSRGMRAGGASTEELMRRHQK